MRDREDGMSGRTEEADRLAPAQQKRRIRNYLIDSSIQLRLASYLVAVACLISIGMGWLLWSAYRESSRLMMLDPRLDETLVGLMAREDRERMLWLGIALVAVILCLLLVALVVTHRVAGPTVAIGQTCRRIGAGDLSRPRPRRRRDLLVDLADEVSLMIEGLRDREEAERVRLDGVVRRLRHPGATPAELESAAVLEELAAEKARRASGTA
jgi:methyl-accepting chemotaxis protein